MWKDLQQQVHLETAHDPTHRREAVQMRMGGLWQEFLRLTSAQSPREASPGSEGVPVQFVSQAVQAESAPCCAHETTSGGEENICLLKGENVMVSYSRNRMIGAINFHWVDI